MVLHEIRETIQTEGVSDQDIVVLQKRINLQSGMRHSFNHMDWFDDMMMGATNQTANYKMQVYVTNYPVILTDETFHSGTGGGMGPLAGDDEVLFKATRLSWSSPQRFITQEFPNNFLGSQPTFTFYTPHLYFTVVWENDLAGATIDREFAMSFYAAIESVEVDSVEYGIGYLREYADHQGRLLRSNGVQISQAQVRGALPLWQMGGMRPQIMSEPTGIVLGEGWFFGQAGYGGAEAMDELDGIRAGLGRARTMVGHTDAFGDANADIPDWFKSIAKPFAGITSGPVRAQQPPLRHFDNGNVRMF